MEIGWSFPDGFPTPGCKKLDRPCSGGNLEEESSAATQRSSCARHFGEGASGAFALHTCVVSFASLATLALYGKRLLTMRLMLAIGKNRSCSLSSSTSSSRALSAISSNAATAPAGSTDLRRRLSTALLLGAERDPGPSVWDVCCDVVVRQQVRQTKRNRKNMPTGFRFSPAEEIVRPRQQGCANYFLLFTDYVAAPASCCRWRYGS